jgi:plastocyanin
MKILRIVLAGVLLLPLAACDGGYSSPSPAPAPAPVPSPSPGGPSSPGGTSSTVTIPMGASTLGRAAFNPGDVMIDAGTTVTWKNADAVAHTSTSDGSGWNSGSVAPGGQFSQAFPTTGTFPYHCAIHPGMVGNVVVR